jgi:hypothetical protein
MLRQSETFSIGSLAVNLLAIGNLRTSLKRLRNDCGYAAAQIPSSYLRQMDRYLAFLAGGWWRDDK